MFSRRRLARSHKPKLDEKGSVLPSPRESARLETPGGTDESVCLTLARFVLTGDAHHQLRFHCACSTAAGARKALFGRQKRKYYRP